MSDQMIGSMFGAAQAATSNLEQITAKAAQRSIDKQFEALARDEGDTGYNKDNYKRLAFESKDDMMDFANAMGEQGVSVNVTATKINGQWMAEMPRKNSDTLIGDYVQNNGREVYEAQDYNTAAQSSGYAQSQMSTFGSFMNSQFDDLGRAVAGLQSFSHSLENFEKKYGGDADKIAKGFREGGTLDEYVNKLNAGLDAQKEARYENLLGRLRGDAVSADFVGKGKEAELLNAVKNDLGVNLPQNFTRDDVLKLNDAFLAKAQEKGLNVALVDKHGNFNVNALKLSNVRQAFSKETLELMDKLNVNGAWGNKVKLNISGKLMKGALKLGEDEDFQKLVSGASKGAQYTKQVSATVHQLNESRKNAANALRAKRTGVKKGEKSSHIIKKKEPKTKKGLSPEELQRRQNKFRKKQSRLKRKLERSEKGLFAKTFKLHNRIMNKVANLKIVKFLNGVNAAFTALLVKIIGFFAMIFLILLLLIVIAVVIIFLIESILNFVKGLLKYAPSYFNKSVAYQLIHILTREEQQWIRGVEEFNTDLITDADEMKFGYTRNSLTSYIKNFEGELEYIKEDDISYFAVNPFYKLKVDNDAFLPENFGDIYTANKRTIDGKTSVDFTANSNVYGYREIDEDDGTYVSTESGHTSNIKDIIAMVDTMYSGDMTQGDSILGESPFNLDRKAFWENTKGLFKSIGHNIGTFFKKLFNSKDESDYITIEDAVGGKTVSYKAVRGYALYLFTHAHGSAVDLDVQYYPVADKVQLNVNGTLQDYVTRPTTGTAITNMLTQAKASQFGVCLTPLSYNHKIFYTDGHVAPYLEDSSGTKYDLGTYDFGTINITIDNAVDKDDLCLRNWFDSNERTWSYIDKEASSIGACWKMTDDASSTDVNAHGYSGSCASESEAKDEALKAYKKSLEDREKELKTNTYLLNGDTFTATRYVWIGTSVPTYNTTHHDAEYEEDDEGNEVETSPAYYTATATGVAYTIYYDSFKRNCKGHTFEYCGGHVGAHMQGITFSMTNEQLTIAAAYNSEGEMPQASDFDFDEQYGGGDLIGKHDLTEVRKSLQPNYPASSVANCYAGVYPNAHPQGSFPAARGLNLYVVGTDLESDMYNRELEPFLLRDIFDIDCMIDKGGNVFPWGSHYEEYDGWSADNMTLALSRTTVDWLENYGLDANIELTYKVDPDKIKGSTVDALPISALDTNNDINAIVEALKANPNNNLTEDREAAVRLALSWLGRGHYSEHHQDHGFLSRYCEAKTVTTITDFEIDEDNKAETAGAITNGSKQIFYNANCTAGDDEDFIEFILNRTGKLETDDVTKEFSLNSYGSWSSYNSKDDLQPADILKHEVTNSFDYKDLALRKMPTSISYHDVFEGYTEERYVFVVGVLGDDVTVQSGRVAFSKGTLLTIDLQLYNTLGTIRLHSVEAKGWEDVGYELAEHEHQYTDDDGKEQKDKMFSFHFKNYYWETNPDVYTKRWNPYSS